MIETKRPPQNIRREIVGLPVADAELALHLWRPRGQVKGAVFYFHGLQSHAGWLWEVGPQFADNDIAFYVLDRRGSGISAGSRTSCPMSTPWSGTTSPPSTTCGRRSATRCHCRCSGTAWAAPSWRP